MAQRALQTKSYTSRGILATALLSGLGLVAATYASYRDAEALADIVNDGQVEGYIRTIAKRQHGPPSTQDLEAIVSEYQSQGIRGAAMVDPHGRYLRKAGEVTPQPEGKPRPRGRAIARVGDRGRYQAFVPPHLPGQRPPANAEFPAPPPPPPRPDRGPDGAFFPPPQGPELPEVLVLEFEPLLAASLVRRAKTLFALSTTVAVLLTTVALVLFRRGAREEALLKKLMQSERLASLGTMSAVLAHEIKNPLAALKGNAQLVAESLSEGTKNRAQADRVVSAAQRLQGLVQNLLDFARGGAVERSETDPAELLFLAAEDAAPSAVLELDEAPPLWSLDKIRMRQVLENLLRNATQAKPDNKIVASVSIDASKDELVYVLRDEGPGFPPEIIQSAFEPFLTTKTRGVGLGLAVSHRVVVMHGGTMVLANRKEGGAEVRISIPKQGLEEGA